MIVSVDSINIPPLRNAVGTVFSSIQDNSPNVDHYLFILDEQTQKLNARQGMFCFTFSEEGMVIGVIESIYVKNVYFEKPQTVKNMDSGNLPGGISRYFPTDQWEDYIGSVRVLGAFPYDKESDTNNKNQKSIKISKSAKRASFPVKPGEKIYILDGDRLIDFIGLENNGLNLGKLEHYDIDVKINMSKLINKHFAVLAISGAGKSYLISDILEELLKRPENVTPGILLIDVHGEYKFISDETIPENKIFAKRVMYYNARYFEISVSNLSAYDIAAFQPNISNPQIRELKKIIEKLNDFKNSNNGKSYDLSDIITEIEKNEMNDKVKEALIGWLQDLERLNLFSKTENPPLKNLIQPGRISILDLSEIISAKKKQIIVGYLADKLFYNRRMGAIPPFVMIIEEAHQFAPEGISSELSISKNAIETIAREGRKFFAQIGLISQRPVKLSTTALSQCNTHIIMRVTNPNDLDHIKASCEALSNENLKLISTLPTGTALIMGSAINLPIFFKVRSRISSNPYGEETLEDVCKKYKS